MKDDSKARPVEQEAVKTTIVGGRPPGSGKAVGNIPRGIEVMVKKASVDEEFRGHLIEKRADAAKEIGLELDPSEIAMLNSVPEKQLELIISRTTVQPKQRTAFLGKVAALMIVALGASTFGCGSQHGDDQDLERRLLSKGVEPDRPKYEEREDARDLSETEQKQGEGYIEGSDEGDTWVPAERGPLLTTGILSDRPERYPSRYDTDGLPTISDILEEKDKKTGTPIQDQTDYSKRSVKDEK